jgi:hypothetical protein
MGADLPIATMMFNPPNDLSSLTIGFVAPSPEHIGAGNATDDGSVQVQLLAQAEDGAEIYGATLPDVKEGEMQSITVAFASRESRDSALAASEAERLAAEEAARQATFAYWISTPMGMVVGGAVVVIVLAIAAIAAVFFMQKRSQGIDGDDGAPLGGYDLYTGEDVQDEQNLFVGDSNSADLGDAGEAK